MKHLKSKISRKLVLYIVLFSSVVTLILTAIQLRIDYNEGIEVIHQRIDQIEFTNIDSIAQALWTINHSSIQIQLDGLNRINDIIYVKITDANNRLILSSGEINTDDTISENIVMRQQYRGQEILLGTLTVVATKENVYQQLIDTVIVILISQAIKTFLVSLFVLVIFYYLVTRHLKKVADYSDKLELTSRPAPLILERSHSRINSDELDRVVDSINSMSDNIYNAYQEVINNQHELAEREAKFSAMFDSMTDTIVFADDEGKILQTNMAFEKQFGYKAEELKGQTTSILYANPDDYKKQGKKRYNAETKSMSSVFEIEYRRKDGSTFPGETMGGAVFLPDGRQIGLIGIIRDISARKQAEEEKAQLQKELQQSQKMEAIGQLTGGIAHDFNNILASILGYSELAKNSLKSTADPSLSRYIQRISDAGVRARDLVRQMMTFSRNAPSDPQVIKLSALINDVSSLIRPTIPSSIELLTRVEKNVPAVLMDDTQMHQILMNLCINARDAMLSNGTLTIKLSYEKNIDAVCQTCKELIQGEYVQLTVEDTGTGIKADLLDSIFEPFLTTKAEGKGTGMGLSVVHGILHKHQSHIIVKTEPGVGTRFHLLIPAVSEPAMTPDIENPPARLSQSDGEGKHILVVDDEESVAMFLQEFLQIYNYKVTVTTSSKQAVDLYRQAAADFDLIITDQTMPEMTGTEMIQQIFQIKPDIPVILCSGYNELVGEKEALELGCSKYLDKPVNNQLLLQVVHETLAARQNN